MTNTPDLRDTKYMPLHIERLQQSKAWLRCKRRPELAFYLFNLWMRAWREVPPGSIEDDDDVLADAAMCSPERWPELKEDLLRGWERRNGRIYHSTVTELAQEVWDKRAAWRARTENARRTLAQKRTASVTDNDTEDVTETVTDTATAVKVRLGNVITPLPPNGGSNAMHSGGRRRRRDGHGGTGNGSANGGEAMAGGGVIPEHEQARLRLRTKYGWATTAKGKAPVSQGAMIKAMQADGLDPAVIDWVCGIAPAPAVIPDV